MHTRALPPERCASSAGRRAQGPTGLALTLGTFAASALAVVLALMLLLGSAPAGAQPRVVPSPLAMPAAVPSESDACDRTYADPDRRPRKCRDKGRRGDGARKGSREGNGANAGGGGGGAGAEAGGAPASGADPAVPGAAGNAVGGQPDPLQSLGVVSPLCAAVLDRNPRNDPRLSDKQVRRCRRSGAVESDYPASNFAFDIQIDASITRPLNVAASTLQTLLQGLWLAWVYFTRGIFALLQWAFSLSPFTDAATLSSLDRKLEAMRRAFTQPLMAAAFGLIGFALVWRGLAKREGAGAIGGTVASCLMIVLASWIIAAPKQTIGRTAQISNDLAKAAIVAPQGKSPRRGDQTFAAALGGAWESLVEEPWCALQFGDVAWCLSAPEPQAVTAADAAAANDLGALGIAKATQQRLLSAITDPGDPAALQKAVSAALRERYGAPRTRAELYWRYSPASAPRNALYYVYSGKERKDAPLPGLVKSALQAASPGGVALDTANSISGFLGLGNKDKTIALAPEKVAIQDEGGTWTRMGLVPIVLFTLTGAALIFGWIAVRLFLQAAVAFVLVLAAPFVLLFAAAGETGRRAFAVWAQSLLGAIIGKAFYAAILGVTLAGGALLGDLSDRKAWGLTFMLMGLFYWAVFLKRQTFAAFLAPPLAADRSDHGGNLRLLAGGYLGWQVGRQAVGAIRGATGRAGGWVHAAGARRDDRRVATDQATQDVARERTRARLGEYKNEHADRAEGRQRERTSREHELATVGDELRTVRQERTAVAHEHDQAAARLARAAERETPASPADRERRAQLATRRAELDDRVERLSARRERLQGVLAQSAPQAQADRQLLAARARTGGQWSPRELDEDAQRLKRRLAAPPDSAENLRHYKALDPHTYRSMPAPERERVLREIEVERLREQRRFSPNGELAALPDSARPVGSPPPAAQRAAARSYRQALERREPIPEARIAEHRRAIARDRFSAARRTRRPTRGG